MVWQDLSIINTRSYLQLDVSIFVSITIFHQLYSQTFSRKKTKVIWATEFRCVPVTRVLRQVWKIQTCTFYMYFLSIIFLAFGHQSVFFYLFNTIVLFAFHIRNQCQTYMFSGVCCNFCLSNFLCYKKLLCHNVCLALTKLENF